MLQLNFIQQEPDKPETKEAGMNRFIQPPNNALDVWNRLHNLIDNEVIAQNYFRRIVLIVGRTSDILYRIFKALI